MLFRFSVFLCVLLGGCILPGIDWETPPPADWPLLAVKYYEMSIDDIATRCPNVVLPVGCAVVNFALSECYVYTATSTPWIVEHEEKHCLGYDHYGDSTMRDAWKQWKENNDPSS